MGSAAGSGSPTALLPPSLARRQHSAQRRAAAQHGPSGSSPSPASPPARGTHGALLFLPAARVACWPQATTHAAARPRQEGEEEEEQERNAAAPSFAPPPARPVPRFLSSRLVVRGPGQARLWVWDVAAWHHSLALAQTLATHPTMSPAAAARLGGSGGGGGGGAAMQRARAARQASASLLLSRPLLRDPSTGQPWLRFRLRRGGLWGARRLARAYRGARALRAPRAGRTWREQPLRVLGPSAPNGHRVAERERRQQQQQQHGVEQQQQEHEQQQQQQQQQGEQEGLPTFVLYPPDAGWDSAADGASSKQQQQAGAQGGLGGEAGGLEGSGGWEASGAGAGAGQQGLDLVCTDDQGWQVGGWQRARQGTRAHTAFATRTPLPHACRRRRVSCSF